MSQPIRSQDIKKMNSDIKQRPFLCCKFVENDDLQSRRRSFYDNVYKTIGLNKSIKNRFLMSIKVRYSVAKLRKMTIYNPKVDYVNDNVYTKFG